MLALLPMFRPDLQITTTQNEEDTLIEIEGLAFTNE